MSLPHRRHLLRAALTLLAAALLGIGAVRQRKVYDVDSGSVGLLIYQKIPDRQLVIDATFSGAVRREGRLVSTYDRRLTLGKRKCPS